MSPTMWFWRVIFPGAGLAVCVLVLWNSTHAVEPSPLPTAKASARHSASKRPTSTRILAEGRLAPRRGAEVTVGTELGGTIVSVSVAEKARVHRGDVLVELRSDDQRADLAEAEARLAEIDVELGYQRREYQRQAQAATATPQVQAELDATRRAYDIAVARRKAAGATLDRCRSALAKTRIVSPIDGTVLACLAQPGETIAPMSRLVTVCDLSRAWIEAEVDEFDAARVVQGTDAIVSAEGYTTTWKGTVEEVPDRVAERSVRPDDPGRPLDTRVLVVKIALAQPTTLRMGQRVEVEIRVPR